MGAGKAKPRAEIGVTDRQHAVRVPAASLRRLVRFVAEGEGFRLAGVDIAVVAAEEMAELNRRYFPGPGPTDVLSFDLSDAHRPGIAAQVVVCGDLAAAQGPPHGCSAAEELQLYVIHGLLHLMGYDDKTARGRARMHAREEGLLAEFLRTRARR